MDTQRPNLYILAFVLFVVMLGYGIVIPIFCRNPIRRENQTTKRKGPSWT